MYFHYDSRQWITTETWIRLISYIISQCSCFPVNETFFTSSQREKRLFFKDDIQTLQHISCPLCESSPVLTPAWRFRERVSQFGPKDSVSEGEASPSLLCEAKVCYIRWSLTNSSYWRDVEDVEVHTAARFIWNSSAFSLFSSSSLFSHIQSDHHLTAYYCNDITHRGLYGGVVYRAVSTRGRGLYGGVVCTAAAGSVCSVHINEMFHMKPC